RSTPLRSSCFLSWRVSSRRTLIREIFEENGARMYTGIQTVLKDTTLGTWCGDSPRNAWLQRVPTVEGATFGTGPASRVLPRAGDRMG
ncbi:unnamed protein product, partial [Ectocarpus sp. 8 AP-2014]